MREQLYTAGIVCNVICVLCADGQQISFQCHALRILKPCFFSNPRELLIPNAVAPHAENRSITVIGVVCLAVIEEVITRDNGVSAELHVPWPAILRGGIANAFCSLRPSVGIEIVVKEQNRTNVAPVSPIIVAGCNGGCRPIDRNHTAQLVPCGSVVQSMRIVMQNGLPALSIGIPHNTSVVDSVQSTFMVCDEGEHLIIVSFDINPHQIRPELSPTFSNGLLHCGGDCIHCNMNASRCFDSNAGQ